MGLMQRLGLAPADEYDLDAALTEARTRGPDRGPHARAQDRRGYVYGVPEQGLDEWTASTVAGETDRRTQLVELYEAYRKCPWAWAGVNAIARRVTAGGLEFVYDPGDGESGDDEQPNKPAEVVACERLFAYCNERQSIVQLLRAVVAGLVIGADAFIEIVWIGRVPVALHLLPARDMTPLMDEHGQLTGYVQLTEYGKRAQFEPHQVVWISLDDPEGSPFGSAPLAAALVAIERWLFAAATQLHTYRKGDPLQVHVDLPADMSGPDIRRWVMQFLSRNVGPANIGYPVVTKNGGTVNELGVRRIEAQNAVLDKARDEILAALGVPPAQAGVIESGNLGGGTGESQDKTFSLQTCDPLADVVLAAIQFHIAERGFGVTDWRLRFAEVDTRDSKTIEEIRETRFRNGAFTLNEWRAEIGLPAVEGGDQAMVLVAAGSVMRIRDIEAAAFASIAKQIQGTGWEIEQTDNDDDPIMLVRSETPPEQRPQLPPADTSSPPAGPAARPAGDEDPDQPGEEPEQPRDDTWWSSESAAAEVKTGGMVALLPDPDTASRLAAAGGLPVEELHLTLAYLGDVTDWAAEQRDDLVDTVREMADGWDPVAGRVLARTVFNAEGGPDGQEPCAVYLISDAAGLDDIRTAVRDDVEARDGVPAQREPFVAHVTGGYNLPADRLPGTGDVRFDRVVVALADDWTEIPLPDPKADLPGELQQELAGDGMQAYVDEAGHLWLWDALEVRYVRTAAGARRYGVAIGDPIPTGRRKNPGAKKPAAGGSATRKSPATGRVQLTVAQRDVAQRAFGDDDDHGATMTGAWLDVADPQRAIARLDQAIDSGDLTTGQRRSVNTLRGKIAKLVGAGEAGDGLTYTKPRRPGDLSPEHEAFLKRFPVQERPRQQGWSAFTRIVTDPKTGQRMVYKRIDDDPELIEAEVLGYLIGDAIGAKVPRVRRLDENAVAMDFIEGDTIGSWLTDRGINRTADAAWYSSRDATLLAVMDFITGNGDRNTGNAMVGPDGSLWGIDHESVLLLYAKHGVTSPPPNEMVSSEFGDRPWEREDVTVELLDEIEPRLAALQPQFERVGGDALYRHDMLMGGVALLRAEVERRDREQRGG